MEEIKRGRVPFQRPSMPQTRPAGVDNLKELDQTGEAQEIAKKKRPVLGTPEAGLKGNALTGLTLDARPDLGAAGAVPRRVLPHRRDQHARGRRRREAAGDRGAVCGGGRDDRPPRRRLGRLRRLALQRAALEHRAAPPPQPRGTGQEVPRSSAGLDHPGPGQEGRSLRGGMAGGERASPTGGRIRIQSRRCRREDRELHDESTGPGLNE